MSFAVWETYDIALVIDSTNGCRPGENESKLYPNPVRPMTSRVSRFISDDTPIGPWSARSAQYPHN